MNRLKVVLLALVLVALIQGTSQLDPHKPIIVQPPSTITYSAGSNGAAPPSHKKEPAAAKSLAQEINSQASTSDQKQGALKDLREHILQNKHFNDETVQMVRESHLLNALHEAIDEKIVGQSFIQTLASVGEPPLIKDYTRDTLLVNSITEDVRFTYGENVFAWKTLELKNDDQHVIVGLTRESIVILNEHFGEYSLQQVVPMETVPSAFEVITVWDTTEDEAVSCLVVSTELSLVWYTMRSKSKFALTEEWRWPLHKMTTLIKCFRYKDVHMILLVGTHPNKLQSVSATLYEFNFELQQFWLMQKLVLNYPCKTIGLVNVGSEFLVAFPQNDKAMIYSLEAGKKYRGKFSSIANFTSEQIGTVGAFQIGRYAYVAIGGKSPQILRYANGNFTSQNVPTQALETVEAFFEVPTHTFRDDLVLLVQHKMTFSTHELQRLEILVWNGESFDIRSNIPCYVEDEIMDNEVSCLLDLQRPTGIVGSTIVQRGKQVSMIVPRYQAHSSLFLLQIETLSGEHPITQKIQEMHETIDAFTKIIQYQDSVINQALELIAESQLFNQQKVVLENCTFGSVQSTVTYLHSNLGWPNDQITIGNITWTPEDTAVNVPLIAQGIEHETARLVQLEHQLKYTVRRHNDSFSLNLEQPLHVQGQVEIGGSLVTDDLYVRRLEEEPFTIRVTREAESLKELHLKDLKVRYLNFDLVNGEPASELVYNTGNKLELPGKIIFEDSLTARNVILPKGGTVNGVDLSESTIYFNCKNRRWKDLQLDFVEAMDDITVQESINGMQLDLETARARFRDASTEPKDVIEAESMVLDGSLYFQTINGIPWVDIIQQVVLKNRPNRLAELRIDGDLILEHPNISVYHLNELAFPGEYLLSSSPGETIVTGFKRFVNTTYINTLDIETTVNGIDLKEIITLHDDQHIPGNVTFSELHVSEGLEVKGNVRGKHLDEFLENPSLLQTSHVKASCHFKQLHVDGPVVVKESFNDMDVDAMLGDVVYATERNVEIAAVKRIGTAEFLAKVTIASNMVNEFKLSEFVTRSTDQEFDVDEISGDVFFQQLTLDGLYDGLNATELDANSVKLFGDQYTEASLIFKNPKNFPHPDIEASQLHILKRLNSKSRSEYLDVEQDELVLSGDITINNLDVLNLQMGGSVLDGPSKSINNVHLPTFDSLRFSLTRPQQVAAPFYIDKLIVGSQIGATYVNNRDFRSLKADLDRVDNFKSHLLLGNIPIENLYIEGDLQVNMLNDINFDTLLQEVIWLDRSNRIPGTVQFLDPVMVDGNMTTRGLINSVDFGEFMGDVVLKSAGVAEFHATKTFTNGLVVEGNVQTENINNIHVKDLALKNQTIYLRGNVEIAGQLFVDHLMVEDRLNGEPIQSWLNLYKYDESRDVHVITGDMFFHKVFIQALDVQGSLNQIPNVDVYLASLIRKDQDYNFTKPIVFKSEVFFEKGFLVRNLNGVDISNIANEIVRINEAAPVELFADVVFTGPVFIEQLTVAGDLIAPNIAGCNPDQWAANGIMINKNAEIFTKTVFAPGTFIADHVKVAFLNGIPMDKLVTLHTDQTIETPMIIDEMTITQALEVGGLINGVSFPYERQNTLMTYGNQRIRVPTIFNSIRVLNSLTLPPILNGKPFGPPVLIGPKMLIESPISFRHLIATSLVTEDMISGVDFNHWYENSLWTTGRDHQVIHSKVFARNVRFEGNVEGNGMINGVDIKDVIRRMRAAKKNVENQLHDTRAQVRSLCSSTKDLVDKTQSRMYFFKYFVQRHVINEHRAIESFHFFDHLGYHFLATNLGCESHFYQWDPVGKSFVPVFKFYTGIVEQWQTVVDGDRSIYLVTRSSTEHTECKILGMCVWLFTGVQLRLMWHVAEADSVQAVHSDPTKPDSFYVHKDDKVMEYGVDGSVLEQWELPKSILGYRFVPSAVGLGLALSDGKLLVLLSNVNKTEGLTRSKRNSNETITMALFATQSMYDRMAKNISGESVSAPSPDLRDVTDVIEPDVLKPKPYDRTSNESLVHINQARIASLPYGTLQPRDLENEEDSQVEATIAKEIPLGGIFTADNQHFPERTRGDMVAFQAGSYGKKQHLVAVSTVVDTVVTGDHDAIKIYVDIQTGKLYQVLPCYRPSHLTALELRDETVLAFLESLQSIQIYIYRGMQGFVKLSSFRLASPAIQMSGVSLPQPSQLKCRLHYLAIATQQQELVLLKAKTQGDCGLTVELDCDLD